MDQEITVTLAGKDRENAMQLATILGQPVERIVADLIEGELSSYTSTAPDDHPGLDWPETCF